MQHFWRLATLISICTFLGWSGRELLRSLRVEAADMSPAHSFTQQWTDPYFLQEDASVATTVAAMAAPTTTILHFFDANTSDLVGPNHHNNNYGKKPEIVVVPTGTSLTVLAQNYHTSTSGVMLQIKPDNGSYTVTQMLTHLPMLDRIMGLAVDSSGNRYYATGVNEEKFIDDNVGVPPPVNIAATSCVS